MPMQLLIQLEMLDALAASNRPSNRPGHGPGAATSHRGGASDGAEPVGVGSSPSSSPFSSASSSEHSSTTTDEACAEAQSAPTALLHVAATPLGSLNASDGAPAARLLRAIRDGRAARWLSPLWNPRKFGARVEIAQEWVDREGVAALFPCSWASHAIPSALQPEACLLLDEASDKEVDWWQALETKAAAVVIALSVPGNVNPISTQDRIRRAWWSGHTGTEGQAQSAGEQAHVEAACEEWCASEPCSELNGDPVSILRECGGCDATHAAGCWPGAADFPK